MLKESYMEFVGVRVIKADLISFNNLYGRQYYRLSNVGMFRDGMWAGCIECPLRVHSLPLMRIMDRLREFASSYFMSADEDGITIFFQ